MVSDKFKKNTNNEEKIKNIQFFSFNKEPKDCKVIKVNLDLSLVVIFSHKGKLYKWKCILDNIPQIKSMYYKISLEKLVLNKYLKIVINHYNNGLVYGILYNELKSVNAYFLFLMHTNKTNDGKIKINKYPFTFTYKGLIYKPKYNEQNPLETIEEEEEEEEDYV